MQKWWLIILCCILLWLCPSPLAAEEGEEEFDTLDRAVDELDAWLASEYGGLELRTLYDNLRAGNYQFDGQAFLRTVRNLLLDEVAVVAALLSQLFVLGIVAALCSTLSANLDEGRLSLVGQWVIFLAFATVALKSLQTTVQLGSHAIEQSSSLLYAILPVVMTAITALGGVTSMLVVRPAVFMGATAFLGLLERFFLPLVLVLAALAFINHLSPSFSFAHLSKLIRDIVLFLLTSLLTLFTALLGMTSLASSAIDGLSLKLAKSAMSNFIPLVGGHLADALDTVLGASLLLKNAIGVFGLLAILLVIALPSIRLLIIAFCYRLCAALLEPFGEGPYIGMLNDFGSALTVLFAIVAVAGLTFFILLFFLIGIGNLTMMFR